MVTAMDTVTAPTATAATKKNREVHKKPVLYNTRNIPIFHFIFASNNATAIKIATEIIGKNQ